MRAYKVILFLIVLMLFSCNKKIPHNNSFYSIRNYYDYSGHVIDTVLLKKREYHEEEDSLYYKKEVIVGGYIHELRKYSNIHRTGIDGEHILYELDSLGVIFFYNFHWKSRSRLYSSNDSINRLVNFCIEEALVKSEYDCMIE